MINLSGRDLRGLARGVAIFKSIKNAEERMKDPQGLYELVDIENTTSEKCARCGHKEHLATCGACSVGGRISPNHEFEPENKKNDGEAEYPHDILPNKKDGLKRGKNKYGPC